MFNKFVLAADGTVVTAADQREQKMRDLSDDELSYSISLNDIKFLLLRLDEARAKLVETTSRLEALEHD